MTDGLSLLWTPLGIVLATMAIHFTFIAGPSIWTVLTDTVRGLETPLNRRLPDRWFFTRAAPPWRVPRTLYTSASRRERADIQLLIERLDLVRQMDSGLGYGPFGPLAPGLYGDRHTGQHWRSRIKRWDSTSFRCFHLSMLWLVSGEVGRRRSSSWPYF